MTHYYILPDGSCFDNMKEARYYMGIGTDAFRSLVRKRIIKKVVNTQQQLQSDDTTPFNKEKGL